jgi:hypothetical protein
MRWKLFSPTCPSSLFAATVGSTFFALDLAALSQSLFAVGIGITRTSSGPGSFDLDTYRLYPKAPPEKRVKVDRWAVTCTGSAFMRATSRQCPPGPSGHYPGVLPPELARLWIGSQSSVQP